MLVLSRKPGEEIVIGENVTIKVIEIRGDKVRMGIIAPREIPVHRKEIFDLLIKEKKEDATALVAEKIAE